MWEAFLEQRKIEMTPSESDEEADEKPEPKKGKSPVKGLKGASVDSDEDSPIQPKSPPAKQQSWVWDSYYHQRAPWRHRPLLEEEEKMWRCGDPPSMWQMCDSPEHEMLVGLSNIELGNLLAGLHPRDVKRHGYTITRVLCTLHISK